MVFRGSKPTKSSKERILLMIRNARHVAFSLALFACATPGLAADKRSEPPQLTQQDLNDVATALAIVGSHCNADQVQACQAGADSKVIFVKLQGIFQAQQESKAKK
jgi:hypothetical protein